MKSSGTRDGSVERVRAVRVFVSSTFRDMGAERDLLVKYAFPQLRKVYRRRGLELAEIDLRWGVTEAEVEREEIVPICFAEIDRCQPFFLGFIGQRYGTIPARLDDDLLARYPWLREHSDRSTTELEILHGVLRAPAGVRHAFFYFRDASYLEHIPETKRCDFAVESATAARRRRCLEQAIESAGLPIRRYSEPKEIAALVVADLLTALDSHCPAQAAQHPLQREYVEHRAVAQSRVAIYVSRAEQDARLDEHARGSGPPLLVVGPPGAGKTAALANWIDRYKRREPDHFVWEHYLGSTPESVRHVDLARRMVAEIGERHGLTHGIPLDETTLKPTLSHWLSQAAEKGPCVLALDGLDLLEARVGAKQLGWFPDQLPANVRLIVSSGPGPTQTLLERRGFATLAVAPLTTHERERLLVDYLGQFGKRLSAEMIREIVADERCAQPLYLRIVLNELRFIAGHEQLGERVRECLSAGSLQALFDKVLSRLEHECPAGQPDLVARAMSLLWASRRGLSESDLAELLGDGQRPLPAAYLSTLLLGAAECLEERGGRVTFGHDALREAVEKRYLSASVARRKAHLQLADYLERAEDERSLAELPWHLMRATAWARLRRAVTLVGVFRTLQTDHHRHELLEYVRKLDKRYDMVASYLDPLPAVETSCASAREYAVHLQSLGAFLEYAGHLGPAERLYQRALLLHQQGGPSSGADTAETLYELARLLRQRGRYQEAETLFRRCLVESRRAHGTLSREVAHTSLELAYLLSAQGRLEDAELLVRRACKAYKALPDHLPSELAVAQHELAGLRERRGDYAGAERLLKDVIVGYAALLGAEHPQTAMMLCGLGRVLNLRITLRESEPTLRRALSILERTLGLEHPGLVPALHELARALWLKGSYPEAAALTRRATLLVKRRLGREHPWLSALSLLEGQIFLARGRPVRAEEKFRRTLSSWQAALGPRHSEALHVQLQLARALRAQGQGAASARMLRKILRLTSEPKPNQHMLASYALETLAELAMDRGRLSRAESLCREALALQRVAFGSQSVETALTRNLLGRLYERRGDRTLAARSYRQALAICQASLGQAHPRSQQLQHALTRLRFAL